MASKLRLCPHSNLFGGCAGSTGGWMCLGSYPHRCHLWLLMDSHSSLNSCVLGMNY